MAEKYFIGDSLREKLRTTIARVDGLPLGGGLATRIPTVFDEGSSSAPKTVRICEFTGTWAINTDKEVTFKGVTSTPNTVSVTNIYAGVNEGTGMIAKDGTAWYLISVDLTTQPGYSSSGTQVLTMSSGSLLWIGTTACT